MDGRVDAVLSKLDEKDTQKRAGQAMKGGDREKARDILARKKTTTNERQRQPAPGRGRQGGPCVN
jgi:hypothetical protein